MLTLDFPGSRRLVDALDAAVGEREETAITEALRTTLCRLMRAKDVALPDCCFERASAADPTCAMALWGAAYAAGPYYNKPWNFFDPQDLAATVARTHALARQAQALAVSATPAEPA